MYTAKMLPVNGELKAGDKVRSNGAVVTLLKKEGEGDTWKTDGFPTYVSNVQKVKLFLVSDSIEKGDEITNYYLFTRPYRWRALASPTWDRDVHAREIGGKADTIVDDAFKIIGEIINPDMVILEGQQYETIPSFLKIKS